MIATSTTARIPDCGEETDRAFYQFARQLEAGSELQTPVDVPSLEGCNPSLQLRRILAQDLSDAILAASKSEQGAHILWMADTLERVQQAFERGRHRNDFHLLSEAIFLSVHSEFQNLPAIPPFEARLEFGGLDPLIQALTEDARREGVRPSATPSPPPPTNLPAEPQTPSAAPSGEPKIRPSPIQPILAFSAVAAALMIILALWLRSRKSKPIDENYEEEPDPKTTRGEAPPLRAESPPPPLPVVSEIDQLQERLATLEQKALEQRALEQELAQPPEASAIPAEFANALQALKKNQTIAVEGIAKDLEQIHGELTKLQRGLADLRTSQKFLGTKVHDLRTEIDARPTEPQTPIEITPPLEAQFETEQALLREDWQRFLATKKELGELIEAASEGAHRIVFDELLRELPRAAAAVSDHGEIFDSALAPLHLYNQQLKRLRLISSRSSQAMPTEPEAQLRKLLGFRDSAQLLATFRNTDAGEALLDFDPARWCREVLPRLADLFLRDYQTAVQENQTEPLEKAYDAVLKALRLAQLEPIEITLGETDFDGELHVGKAPVKDSRYPDGTVAQVLKNGFRSLSDGRIVIRPEVTVNRI